jgi:hypothetical protein
MKALIDLNMSLTKNCNSITFNVVKIIKMHAYSKLSCDVTMATLANITQLPTFALTSNDRFKNISQVSDTGQSWPSGYHMLYFCC